MILLHLQLLLVSYTLQVRSKEGQSKITNSQNVSEANQNDVMIDSVESSA